MRLTGLPCVNYLPTWARVSSDMWLNMPAGVLRRELGFASGLGFRGVRVWLNCWGWVADPGRYTAHVKLLMDTAHDLGLGVAPILFDSCGVEPEFGEAIDRPLEDALDGWRGHPALAAIEGLGRDSRTDMTGPSALVRVADRGEPAAIVWEWFRPGPGYPHLADRERWERYVRDIVGVVAAHPALLVIDLMNEPYVTRIGHTTDLAPIDDFVVWAHALVRRLAPEAPLTIGDADLQSFVHHDGLVGHDLQVVSFHEYVHEHVPYHQPAHLSEKIARVLEYAGDRPAFMSECGTFPGMHDSEQLDVYREELGVWRSSGVAWAPFHLIAGYGLCAMSSLLYPNGTMRPAAMHLREILRRG